jgi:uncharacterized protein YbcC (UPF0753/DUF2309 family)
MDNLRERISATLKHLDHVLPGQAPILNFVHHNTLHGYQHLSFEQALAEAERLTGIRGYLPEDQFRGFYRQGRIDAGDIDAVLTHAPNLVAAESLLRLQGRNIARRDLYRIALLYDTEGLTPNELTWRIEELQALRTVQEDVPPSVREQLLNGKDEGAAIDALWRRCLELLNVQYRPLHPENMLDLSGEQAEALLAYFRTQTAETGSAPLQIHEYMRTTALDELQRLCADVGDGITLRGFLLALTGTDILDTVRPQLIRICASALDEGLAAWQLPGRVELGFYAAWRETCRYDLQAMLYELPDGQRMLDELPETALDAIILQLSQLGIPLEKWDGYLQRLALELPGWSGMINWRQQHPEYRPYRDAKPQLADYLAIRLTLDRLWLKQLCRETWQIDANLSTLLTYWQRHLSEFMVRRQLYFGVLPEYLTHAAEALTLRSVSERHDVKHWRRLADLIWTWRFSPEAGNQRAHSAHRNGWRLFRLAQHLGLNAETLQQASKADAEALLATLDAFTQEGRAKVWLYAYERHYRDAFFRGLRANRMHGRWAIRNSRPEVQIIFCMDDREEGIRRHLEEHNPAIETLGAAGFFGVAMNYQGLDDTGFTALCPVVVIPAHNVREISRPGFAAEHSAHVKGLSAHKRIMQLFYQGLRRYLLLSQAVMDAAAPLTLLGLAGKAFIPGRQAALVQRIRNTLVPDVPTELHYGSCDSETPATPAYPRFGFNTIEQADRVAGFLRNTGLTYGFGPLIVLMGHGSISQNNPHLAAYDCGACSGRHGGPNARAFAAMANRPEIRRLLAERGIHIPADTWFIGAEHNTCNEAIIWYDLSDLPTPLHTPFKQLQRELDHARTLSAHERCRRLASAPRRPSGVQALRHIEERAADYSQARPELGHATNAAAIVGRRALSQGVFFDRRVFLISYDPTQDTDGKIVEGILLAVGPVGAGINLEYYFSTVNTDRYGCGSKVPHNVTGLLGVMEGASSDLRTGLPKQMTEIHEAMRLQLLVEAKTTVLEAIYARQDGLRELIANGWVHLSAIDPDSGVISVFECGMGFVAWNGEDIPLPVYADSPSCYQGATEPVPPALIRSAAQREML